MLAGSLADLEEAARGGRPLALRCADALSRERRTALMPEDPSAVAAVVRQLAARGRHRSGLQALGLTTLFGRRHGWPGEWRDLLRTLRGHPAADVRDGALWTSSPRRSDAGGRVAEPVSHRGALSGSAVGAPRALPLASVGADGTGAPRPRIWERGRHTDARGSPWHGVG
ncbi:hypothetical protein GCM10020229_47440 [Kitasatospora albolonga]